MTRAPTNHRTVAELVRQLSEHAPAVRREVGEVDPRMAAAVLSSRTFGISLVEELPVLLNFAALALLMHPLVAHLLTPEVCQLVDETDLHTLPASPPRLLQGAWILEPRRGESLFGDTTGVGGYSVHGRMWLVGLRASGAAMCVPWEPQWTGEELAAGLPTEETPVLDVGSHAQHADWRAWGREAARFALVFAILRDAEKAPLSVTDESARAAPGPSKKAKPPPAWVTRHVSLFYRREAGSPKGGAAAGRSPGLVDQTSTVRGHLKRQPHGPGGAERKWVYVDAYEARRWVSARPRKVVVSL